MNESEIEYAGFWVRCGATCIDTILIMLVIYPLLVAIYGWGYFTDETNGFVAGPADFLITWVLPAIAVIFFWTKRQATPGKSALSIRVVDARTGRPLSLGQSLGRYLAYFISAIPLCVGYLWVAFDGRKQGWHDKLAGTVVIRAKNRGPEAVRFPEA